MTSGQGFGSTFIVESWGQGFCGITFDFIRPAYAAR